MRSLIARARPGQGKHQLNGAEISIYKNANLSQTYFVCYVFIQEGTSDDGGEKRNNTGEGEER